MDDGRLQLADGAGWSRKEEPNGANGPQRHGANQYGALNGGVLPNRAKSDFTASSIRRLSLTQDSSDLSDWRSCDCQARYDWLGCRSQADSSA